uniref:Retrotransposon gag domain-containing protein n=1 Tax=Monopterus albus TaxID=43700 RepID=A0A3Q3QJX5_MONAL
HTYKRRLQDYPPPQHWTVRPVVLMLAIAYNAWQRLFDTLPDQGTTFDEAMAAFEKHFVPKVNVLACRHTFRQRVQHADETVCQYVTELRALAVPCGFGTMESELIRDQLIANAQLSAVKDKLLLEEGLTLDKALTIACQVEAAVKNATLLSSANTVLVAPVQAVGAANVRFRGKRGARPAQTKAELQTDQSNTWIGPS